MRMIKQLPFILSGLLFLFTACSSQQEKRADFHVVPLPQQIDSTGNGAFLLSEKTLIAYPANDEELKRNAALLADFVAQKTGMKLQVKADGSSQSVIALSKGLSVDNPEAYSLTVSSQRIDIQGAAGSGVFYGIQTLRKALPICDGNATVSVPLVSVKDAPRFSYRGAHLDVSRHFFTVDSIKRYIDMLALHNINVFHWHLTDDQGWRIEIKSRPELTKVGAWREGTVVGRNSGTYVNERYGGFYSQDEIKDLVKYAAQRYVNIIPEIDLPGHMQAALAAYPYLGCTGGPYEVWKQWACLKMCFVPVTIPFMRLWKMYWVRLSNFSLLNMFTLAGMNVRKFAGRNVRSVRSVSVNWDCMRINIIPLSNACRVM